MQRSKIMKYIGVFSLFVIMIFSNPIISTETGIVSASPVDDDSPILTVNTGITLDEGSTETINGIELYADDPDTDNNILTYVVTSGPSNGQLELTTNPGIAITSFTQAQLSANQVVYKHDDSNTTVDSFTFDVQDGSGNNLTGQTFSIAINRVDDDSPILTVNTGITLVQGTAKKVNNSELYADDPDTDNNILTYFTMSGPSNGQLELTINPGIPITSFTQAQLSADQVVYVHNNSNTTMDRFTFSVKDGSGNNLMSQTFSITVNSSAAYEAEATASMLTLEAGDKPSLQLQLKIILV